MARNKDKENNTSLVIEGEDINTFNVPITDEEDNENPYPTKVRFAKEQYSFFEIKRALENEEIITPSFQRNSELWNSMRKSLLIESILMGIPLPLFYFAAQEGAQLAIVDGLQRITTVLDYMNNKFSLTSLTYLEQYKGKKFKDLERDAASAIERYQIQVNVIDIATPEKIKLDIFERINSRGTQLNKQEMRNAIYSGQSTQLLDKLARLDSFKQIIKSQIDEKRMKDRYYILRFLTFYLYFNKDKFNNNLEIKGMFDISLASAMKIINKFDNKAIKELQRLFEFTIGNIKFMYGETAFKRENDPKNPFNLTMFESLLFLFSHLDIEISTLDNREINKLKNRITKIFETPSIKNNFIDSLKGQTKMIEHFTLLQESVAQIKEEI